MACLVIAENQTFVFFTFEDFNNKPEISYLTF